MDGEDNKFNTPFGKVTPAWRRQASEKRAEDETETEIDFRNHDIEVGGLEDENTILEAKVMKVGGTHANRAVLEELFNDINKYILAEEVKLGPKGRRESPQFDMVFAAAVFVGTALNNVDVIRSFYMSNMESAMRNYAVHDNYKIYQDKLIELANQEKYAWFRAIISPTES